MFRNQRPPLEKMPESKIWKVSVRSQKGQHHVEAANVKDADGKVTNWTLTTVGPSVYHKAGLTRNFVKVGDTYTVTLCAAKDGSQNLAFVKTWKYADGHTVNVWFGDPGQFK